MDEINTLCTDFHIAFVILSLVGICNKQTDFWNSIKVVVIIFSFRIIGSVTRFHFYTWPSCIWIFSTIFTIKIVNQRISFFYRNLNLNSIESCLTNCNICRCAGSNCYNLCIFCFSVFKNVNNPCTWSNIFKIKDCRIRSDSLRSRKWITNLNCTAITIVCCNIHCWCCNYIRISWTKRILFIIFSNFICVYQWIVNARLDCSRNFWNTNIWKGCIWFWKCKKNVS